MTTPSTPPGTIPPSAGKPAAADQTVLLDGPAGRLEVAIDQPEANAPALPVLAIVCHPLPTEGGTMHNKVVTMTARALRECGVTSVRFNFRGIGQSEGSFDEGEGEVDDLRAVIAWARARYPHHALWLAGFSFGAYVSLRVAAEAQADLLLSIAPPVERSWDFSQAAHPNCPWLVIQGEADEIVDPQAVYAWVEQLEPPPELVRMPDASHFFHHRLMDLRGAIKSGVRPYLPAATA
jgi:alpha/beta superfamily hydrolase